MKPPGAPPVPLALVAAVMVGCGGGSASSLSSPSSSPAASVVAVAAASGAPARPADAPTEIVVLPPAAGPSVLLSAEEQAAVSAQAVARVVELERAAGRPVVPWPSEQQRTVAELLAAGRVREGGPVCASPPGLGTVLAALLPGAPQLRVALDCEGDSCSLQADLEYASGGALRRTWSSVVDADKPAEWNEAARQLSPSDGTVGYGSVGMRARPPPSVQASLVRTSRDFALHFDRLRWRGPERELTRCHDGATKRTEDVEVMPLVMVNESGKVEGCARRDARPASTALLDCACKALAQATFPPVSPGAGARRAVVSVVDYGPEPHDTLRTRKGTFSVQIRPEQVEDPGAQGFPEVLGGPEIRACMIQRGKLEPALVDVTVEADAAGQVNVAEATSTEPSLTGCIETALRHAALGCSTDTRSHTLHGRLDLRTFGPLEAGKKATAR